MFEVGDKVVYCFDFLGLGQPDSLTLGKTYIIERVQEGGLQMLNNYKNCVWYNQQRFISLKESRKQKINKIL